MQQESEKLTQRQRLEGELKEISADVTRGDKQAYHDEKGVSKSKISQYLNGQVQDNDAAIEMLVYFRARIAKRDEVLNSTE